MERVRELWRRVRELEYRMTSYGDLGAEAERGSLISQLRALGAYTRDEKTPVGQVRGGLRLVA